MKYAWLLAMSACIPQLETPADIRITCTSDAECLDGFVCGTAVGLCANKALRTAVGPRLQSAVAATSTSVTLVFDKQPVFPSDPLSALSIDPPLVLIQVELDPADPTRVSVLTAPQRGQTAYTITVNEVTDIFSLSIIDGGKSFTFDGFGVGPDAAAPDFLLPADGEQTRLGMLKVAWNGVDLVEYYDLELWRAGELVRAQRVMAPSVSAEMQIAEEGSYELRLRSDATRADEYAVRRVEAVDQAVYVYCPENESCDDALTGGNRDNPRRSIGRALADAKRLGVENVFVASRGNGAAYEETIDLFAKLTLRGGFDPAFITVTDKTHVHTTEATLLTCNAVSGGDVWVEGFELVSESPNPSNVLTFSNCDDGIVVQNNVIRNLGTNPSRTGILLQSSEPTGAPGPRVLNNEIYSGLGIQVLGVNTIISANTLVVGGIPEAGGIFITGGELGVLDNTISLTEGDPQDGGWVGIYVLQFNPFDGFVHVLGNTIEVASAPRASDGVIFQNGSGVIADNTITTGASTFSTGILLESSERIGETRDWTVQRNTLTIGQGSDVSAAIYIGDRGDRAVARIDGNRATLAGFPDAGTSMSAGIFLGSEGAPSPSSNFFFSNNVLDVGPAPNATSAGAYVTLLGARPKLTFVHNTFRHASTSRTSYPTAPTAASLLVSGVVTGIEMKVVNNLFLGPNDSNGGPAVYSSETTPIVVADHNVAGAVERFFAYPNASINDVDGSAANTSWGDNNVRLTGALPLTLLSPNAGSAIATGGIVSFGTSCGGANDACCGWISNTATCVGVGVDVLDVQRTCPMANQCTSVGAFEVD